MRTDLLACAGIIRDSNGNLYILAKSMLAQSVSLHRLIRSVGEALKAYTTCDVLHKDLVDCLYMNFP